MAEVKKKETQEQDVTMTADEIASFVCQKKRKGSKTTWKRIWINGSFATGKTTCLKRLERAIKSCGRKAILLSGTAAHLQSSSLVSVEELLRAIDFKTAHLTLLGKCVKHLRAKKQRLAKEKD